MSLEKIKIQIVGIDREIKDSADEFVKAQGYRSVQEVLKVFLYKLGRKKVNLEASLEEETFSQNAIKRLQGIEEQIEQDIKLGKIFESNSTDEILKYLNNND